METVKRNIDTLSLSELLNYIKICDYELENLKEKRNVYFSQRDNYNSDYFEGLFDFNSVIEELNEINKEIRDIDNKIEYYSNLKDKIKEKILDSHEYIEFQKGYESSLDNEEQHTDKRRL